MPSQLTREELASMSPADIVAAKRDGRLDLILGRTVTADEVLDTIDQRDGQDEAQDEAQDGQLTRQDLASMSPEAIVKAKRDGRLDGLLGRG